MPLPPTAPQNEQRYASLPYDTVPIEWLSPERLALASMLHGGPQPKRSGYRYLEIGCGNSANLTPLAFYRRDAHFVGLDAAKDACEMARDWSTRLGLHNLDIIDADLTDCDQQLEGTFDFIVAHGVFSWISEATREHLLTLCQERLNPGGLLYLSYNTRPGWDLRGLVRSFLMTHTQDESVSFPKQTQTAQRMATALLGPLKESEHPFMQLMANEFALVQDASASYVGHDYLADHNHAFWRREFFQQLAARGFEHVADADFNLSSGRTSDDVVAGVAKLGLPPSATSDAVDLMSYRQFHCPILTNAGYVRRPPTPEQYRELYIASCLTLDPATKQFMHPNGYSVDVSTAPMRDALSQLNKVWPQGVRAGGLFDELESVQEDLLLLHRNALIELRLVEPQTTIDAQALHAIEAAYAGYQTTPWHTRVAAHQVLRAGPSKRSA